jgi:hypothetical protein
MPDSAGIYAFNTRRDLKKYLLGERDVMERQRSIKDISAFAAQCWGRDKSYTGLPYCLPTDKGENYGIFVSNATRKEYLNYVKECCEN